jgi:hypothetical protein
MNVLQVNHLRGELQVTQTDRETDRQTVKPHTLMEFGSGSVKIAKISGISDFSFIFLSLLQEAQACRDEAGQLAVECLRLAREVEELKSQVHASLRTPAAPQTCALVSGASSPGEACERGRARLRERETLLVCERTCTSISPAAPTLSSSPALASAAGVACRNSVRREAVVSEGSGQQKASENSDVHANNCERAAVIVNKLTVEDDACTPREGERNLSLYPTDPLQSGEWEAEAGQAGSGDQLP